MKRRQTLKLIVFALITSLLLTVALSGCGSTNNSSTQTADGKSISANTTETQTKKPDVIRIGTAFTAGNSNRASLHTFGVLYEHHLLEDEFEKDGIKIEWNFFKGVSPAVNEAFASNTIDFAATSDLGAIVGKSNGLNINLIAAMGRDSDYYLAVPANSTATKIEDLVGKKLATANGTNFQITLARVLAKKGLSFDDFQIYNLGPADGVAALASGDIDAALYSGPGQLFPPRDKGQIKIIYTTADDSTFTAADKTQTSVFVSGEFLEKYPGTVDRFLKAYLKAAQWISLPENQEAYYVIGSHTGQSVEGLRESAKGKDPNHVYSPLIDNAVVNYYTDTVKLMKELGLIENDFDVSKFIVKEPLEKALKETNLEGNWTPN